MPRTLNATLEAALDSGSFQPYFLLTVREVGASIYETAAPVAFKLSGINISAKWVRRSGSVYDSFNYPHDLEFKITRGVTVSGVNYTIDSSYYYGLTQAWDGTFQAITACMLPAQKYTAAADVTYKTLIDALCTAHGKTAVYDEVGAAWQSYKFLGAGKVLNMNRAYDIMNMLKQKYVIYACDNGSDQIRFKAVGTDSDGTTDYTLSLGRFKEWSWDVATNRRFLYRDEAGTVHYDGNATDPLWNLGYLESTASPPTTNFSLPFILEPIAPHLKYLSFDQFNFTFGNYPETTIVSAPTNMWVEEEYDYKFPELGWRIYLSRIDWAKGTEGGALPGTIEAAAPFTPLNTSNFNGILSTNDNNLQAAMETIDDHEHTPAAVGAIPNDAWIAGTGTWSYSSADAPTFVISINADVTALIGVGDRIKHTQTTIKYFIVTAVGAFGGGATLVTVYGGTDYTLANAAITSPYYSHVKAPFGFPMSPIKWTETLTDTTQRSQAPPVAGTWYNLGSLSKAVPIGAWRASLKVLGQHNSGGAVSDFSITLSTANNSESNVNMTANGVAVAGAGTIQSYLTIFTQDVLVLTSKTTHYINTKSNTGGGTLYNRNEVLSLLLTFTCAYL
jgi:hypothetical protein